MSTPLSPRWAVRGWAILLILAAVFTIAAKLKPAEEHEIAIPVSPPPSVPVLLVDKTGSEYTLFGPGPNTVGAIVTLECPACRRELPEIRKWLESHSQSERVILVSLDGPDELQELSAFVQNPRVSVVMPRDHSARITLGTNLHVPIAFRTDSEGDFDMWLSGAEWPLSPSLAVPQPAD